MVVNVYYALHSVFLLCVKEDVMFRRQQIDDKNVKRHLHMQSQAIDRNQALKRSVSKLVNEFNSNNHQSLKLKFSE